jgi:hypothetical protein
LGFPPPSQKLPSSIQPRNNDSTDSTQAYDKIQPKRCTVSEACFIFIFYGSDFTGVGKRLHKTNNKKISKSRKINPKANEKVRKNVIGTKDLN